MRLKPANPLKSRVVPVCPVRSLCERPAAGHAGSIDADPYQKAEQKVWHAPGHESYAELPPVKE
jgi:hypothetical protein